MEQPISDDEEVRSAQVVYRSVEEKFEGVQDEVNLLKAEIKQTLVDLREFMMKQRAISTPSVFGAVQPEPANGLGSMAGTQPSYPASNPPGMPQTPATPPTMNPAFPVPGADGQPLMGPSPLDSQGASSARHGLDTIKMGHIIWWLGTVKSRGLSLKQLKPFLQAYELDGHLTPAMASLTYRSLEDLEEVEEPGIEKVFSSQEYSDCLLQLHEIICTPGFVPSDESHVPPRPKGGQDSKPQQDVKKASVSDKDGGAAKHDQHLLLPENEASKAH